MQTTITTLLLLLKKFTDSSNFGKMIPDKSSEYPFFITSIAECESYFYIGTNHGLLSKNKQNGKLSLLTSENSGLPCNHITSLLFTTDGKWYVGTIHGLVQRRINGFRTVNADNYILDDTHITALGEDKFGRMWIGTEHSGLVKSSDYTPRSYFVQPITFPNQKICSITADTMGAVWIGYRCGAYECFQNNISYNYPSVDAIETEHCKGAAPFLLTSGNQEVFIYNGNKLTSILTCPSDQKLTCTYYNLTYSRMILCHEKGMRVFDIRKPFSESRVMNYSEFIRAISCQNRDQSISKMICEIENNEQN